MQNLTTADLGTIYDALMAEGNHDLAIKVRDIRAAAQRVEVYEQEVNERGDLLLLPYRPE